MKKCSGCHEGVEESSEHCAICTSMSANTGKEDGRYGTMVSASESGAISGAASPHGVEGNSAPPPARFGHYLLPWLPVLASLFLAAHALRRDDWGMIGAWLVIAVLSVTRLAWARLAVSWALCIGAAVWVATAIEFIDFRIALGMDWKRLAIIMGVVTGLTCMAALILLGRVGAERHARGKESAVPQAVAFGLTAALLWWMRTAAQKNTPLLADRLWPGSGLLEITLVAVYAAWVTGKLLDARSARVWRPRLWALFSAVFFGQLLLGLAGYDLFLMTGQLHLPVPALILAGPLYRGEGFFMLGLFVTSVLLVGPAWCSHLCYIGAWDDRCARFRRTGPRGGVAAAASGRDRSVRNDGATEMHQHDLRSVSGSSNGANPSDGATSSHCASPRDGTGSRGPLARWVWPLRIMLGLLAVGTALALRLFGVGVHVALALAAAFGLAGVGVMLILSRRRGIMVHCTAYCPMGLVADLLGRISPWRLRITPSKCTGCGACIAACRYGALSPEQLRAGSPGLTCSLCRDCLGACRFEAMQLTSPLCRGGRAGVVFVVILATLHSVFFAVARM